MDEYRISKGYRELAVVADAIFGKAESIGMEGGHGYAHRGGGAPSNTVGRVAGNAGHAVRRLRGRAGLAAGAATAGAAATGGGVLVARRHKD